MEYKISPEQRAQFSKQLMDYIRATCNTYNKRKPNQNSAQDIQRQLNSQGNISNTIKLKGMDGFRYKPVTKKAAIQQYTYRMLKNSSAQQGFDYSPLLWGLGGAALGGMLGGGKGALAGGLMAGIGSYYLNNRQKQPLQQMQPTTSVPPQQSQQPIQQTQEVNPATAPVHNAISTGMKIAVPASTAVGGIAGTVPAYIKSQRDIAAQRKKRYQQIQQIRKLPIQYNGQTRIPSGRAPKSTFTNIVKRMPGRSARIGGYAGALIGGLVPAVANYWWNN